VNKLIPIVAFSSLILLALLLLAFFNASEMGLYTINRFRLRKRQSTGERSARLLAWLLQDPVGLLVTFLLGTNILIYALTGLVTHLFELAGLSPESRHGFFTAEIAATITLTLPLFLCEVITKNFTRRYTERVSYYFAWGLAATKYLLYPLVIIFRPIAALAPKTEDGTQGLGLPRISKHIIHHLLSTGRETGELTIEQERLARNVLQVGNRRVEALIKKIEKNGSANTPAEGELDPVQDAPPTVRTLTVSSAERTGAVLDMMAQARTRLSLVISPEAQEHPGSLSASEVVGYVRLFDLLEPSAQGKAVGALARPVPRLADHATLRGALTVMQRECADVAVVEVDSPTRKKTDPNAEPHDRPVLGVIRIAQLISELLGAPPPDDEGPKKK
jgi:CBS domain containing-hemolysin-like protein